MFAVWVELQHCSRSYSETVVEALEEFATSFEWVIAFFARHAKPLDCGDTDGSVEHARSHLPSLPNIDLPEPSFQILLCRNVQHIPTNIKTFPDKPIFSKSLAREPRPTPYIKNECARLNVKQFNSTLSNLTLDELDAGVGLVLGSLVDVVVEIRWKLIFGSAHIIYYIYYIIGLDALYSDIDNTSNSVVMVSGIEITIFL